MPYLPTVALPCLQLMVGVRSSLLADMFGTLSVVALGSSSTIVYEIVFASHTIHLGL